MVKIFISYRRKDSEAESLRLYEGLGGFFGATQIFLDRKSILPGKDFEEVIRGALEQSSVIIAVVNKKWLKAADKSGRRRIDEPSDLLRREILYAGEHGRTLIPVLIHNTEMPNEEDLPPELGWFSKRQAAMIRRENFDQDVLHLAEVIQKYLSDEDRAKSQDFSQEIVEDYNAWFSMTATDEGRRLKLYYTSDSAMSTIGASHFITEVIEWLITEADLGFWAKHPDEELSPDEFYARILRAVAASVRVDYPELDELGKTDADIIRGLAEGLG
jgi:hypothetical protein